MGSCTVVSRDLLIRSARDEELGRFFEVTELTFGDETHEGDVERLRTVVRAERTHAAFDGTDMVATAAAYDFTLTVPGGEAAAAGVTMVGVLPTHRRRGLLTRLMREQLDDVHRRGEPLAILFASEPAIYGRFGYGMAVRAMRMNAERARAVFLSAPDPSASVRIVPREEAYAVVAPIYEEVRRGVPGMFARTEAWWRAFRLSDPEHWRHGGGPMFVAVLELDGRPAGFARYRVKGDWGDGGADNELNVFDAFATSPRAEVELWRYLFGIDLVGKVRGYLMPVDHPLVHAVADFRRLRLRVADGLWVRLVDVGMALAARAFENGDPVVVELRDEFCPWNAGRWRLTSSGGERTDEEPELELGAGELGAAYLGGVTFGELARAGRLRERAPGALQRADALFRTPRAPWSPEIF